MSRVKGIKVSVEVDLDKETAVHYIKLSNGHGAFVVPVDESMFTETDDFFDVFVIPQISAALSKRVASDWSARLRCDVVPQEPVGLLQFFPLLP